MTFQAKKDIERLEAGIRTNRWAIGIAVSAIVAVVIGGFGLLAMRISDLISNLDRQISDLKADIRQASHQPTDQARQWAAHRLGACP